MLVLHARLRHVQYFRVAMRQPHGRRGRWRAKDHLQPVLVRQGDCPVEQIKEKGAFRWLKDRPSELGHADHPKPKLAHAAKVIRPQFFGPVFGVVTYAKLQAIQLE
jgi:hypothetical protein